MNTEEKPPPPIQGSLLDPHTGLVEKHYAVIPRPKRARNRFPEPIVELKASREAALADADVASGRYPAIVYGPSRSSEGLRLYYLLEWLA